MDRRHGGTEEGVILVLSRELPHLREVARRTGYRLVPAKEAVPTRISGELERLRSQLARTIKEEELAPYFLALEPLFNEYSPPEVAAAALALLRQKQGEGKPGPSKAGRGSGTEVSGGV